MKRYIFTLLSFLISVHLLGQAPEAFQYQAVLRDSDGNIRSNETLDLGITILQTTATGTEVYSETHSTGTNDHGLINIVIGEGTTSDNFTDIDWSAGPYFVEIEVDGTVMGTTQLLSVPYALNAKTADSIPQLGTLATRSELLDTIDQLRSEIPSVTKYSVGDYAQGGVVFWVDETGQHGLVCAIVDIDGGSGIQWFNGTNKFTGTSGNGLYAGSMNTTLIVAAQIPDNQTGSFAARICAEYSVTFEGIIYGDWYLPSLEELDLMYDNKAVIDAVSTDYGGQVITTDYYWSSNEHESDIDFAYARNFASGNYGSGKKASAFLVRAIRAF